MPYAGQTFWDFFLPSLVVGLSLFSALGFFALGRRFQQSYFAALAVVSFTILAHSACEAIMMHQQLLGLSSQGAHFLEHLQLITFFPLLWVIPHFALSLQPLEEKVRYFLVQIRRGSGVLVILFILLNVLWPESLLKHQNLGFRGQRTLLLEIFGILVVLEVIGLFSLYPIFRRNAELSQRLLASFIPWMVAIFPFAAMELFIDFVSIESLPSSISSFPYFTAAFLLFAIGMLMSALRYVLIKAGMEEEARSDAAASQMALNREILFDSLTNLPNRRHFRETLSRLVDRPVEDLPGRTALILLNLDDFSSYNDTFGHLAGDDLLRDAARRLKEVLREEDELFRVGGDEFAVILHDIDNSNESSLVTSRLIEVFASPVTWTNGTPLFISASAGIAAWPYDGTSSRDLMRHADAALKRAKKHRNSYRTFSPDMSVEASHRIQAIHLIKSALIENRFRLNYQPVTDRRGQMVGAEALVRIEEAGKLIFPNSFIPVAESSGLIIAVGEWVIEQALADRRALSHLPEDFYFSINLSVKQLRDPELVKRVNDDMVLNNLSPESIRFEITESSLMENYREILPAISSFRDLGFKLSLDDFGTGYSSLGYLLELPVDILKLDKAFLTGLSKGHQGQSIVNALLMMARGLEMDVIVEGIEDSTQRDYLAGYEGVYQQGFLHGKPMDLNHLSQLMAVKA